MRLASRLVSARLEVRLNRFTVEARVAGQVVRAHLPNSGRLTELLRPGAAVRLAARGEAWRRTAYDLVAVELASGRGEAQSGDGDRRMARGGWAVVDARFPPRLVEEAWRAGKIDAFRGYTRVQAEPTWGQGRFDLLFSGGDGPDCLVETKSVTLVVGEEARFPDAPTARGRRHLVELAAAVAAGHRAAVVFVIQREDAIRLSPNAATDPDFARALEEAAAAGVEVYAYRCRVTPESIELAGRVAVRVGGDRVG